MTDSKPERLFAPMLHSERLTYTIVQIDSEEDVGFLAQTFNTLFPGGPTDGRWTSADIRRLCFGTMLKPSDTGRGVPKDPAVYIVHLGSAPGIRMGLFNLCRRTPDVPLDLGFSLLPEYQQQGYGTEAGTRIMKYWTTEFGIKEICIVTGEDNVAAKKLSLKLGFIEGGWVVSGGQKEACYVLPGMAKLEGQDFPFWGDGQQPTED
ncbi:hypothetical protein GQ53DRAFT_431076 [Thozetella sp. PMI_491]|nr:hypothetical protein GQ53DRAFT_431076 [Thozetella sp. PMI_491]